MCSSDLSGSPSSTTAARSGSRACSTRPARSPACSAETVPATSGWCGTAARPSALSSARRQPERSVPAGNPSRPRNSSSIRRTLPPVPWPTGGYGDHECRPARRRQVIWRPQKPPAEAIFDARPAAADVTRPSVPRHVEQAAVSFMRSPCRDRPSRLSARRPPARACGVWRA